MSVDWFEVVPHRTDVFIHGFEVFTTFLAVSERSGGLRKLRLQRTGEAPQYLPADDATYTMTLGANPEPTATRLRYVYTSLTTPNTTYEVDRRVNNSRTVDPQDASLIEPSENEV